MTRIPNNVCMTYSKGALVAAMVRGEKTESLSSPSQLQQSVAHSTPPELPSFYRPDHRRSHHVITQPTARREPQGLLWLPRIQTDGTTTTTTTPAHTHTHTRSDSPRQQKAGRVTSNTTHVLSICHLRRFFGTSDKIVCKSSRKIIPFPALHQILLSLGATTRHCPAASVHRMTPTSPNPHSSIVSGANKSTATMIRWMEEEPVLFEGFLSPFPTKM
jgi:hypothetical protein